MTSAVLDRPTLVLNRNWQPVHVATVARSRTMLWNETALVVDPDDFRFTPGPTGGSPPARASPSSWRGFARVPGALTLTRHDRPRQNAVTFSRCNVSTRDHTTCQYCGNRPERGIDIDATVRRGRRGLIMGNRLLSRNALKTSCTPNRPRRSSSGACSTGWWKTSHQCRDGGIASWSRFLSEAGTGTSRWKAP